MNSSQPLNECHHGLKEGADEEYIGRILIHNNEPTWDHYYLIYAKSFLSIFPSAPIVRQ